jgi:hypothetical protein
VEGSLASIDTSFDIYSSLPSGAYGVLPDGLIIRLSLGKTAYFNAKPLLV